MTIMRKALGAVAWTYGGFVSERALGLLTTAFLARLLVPDDFGVLAFALVVIGIVDMLRDFGIKDALIQNAERPDVAARTAAWFGLAIGVTQCALTILAAPLVTFLIADARTEPVIQVLALGFVINAVAMVPDALLQRQLRFRLRALSDCTAAVVKTAATLALALAGFELWAVVAGHLVGIAVRAALRCATAGWRPGLGVDRACARALWQFGKHILFVSIAGALLTRADQIAVALLLGSTSLGYYYIAARLPELTIAGLSMVLTTVLFPAYSAIRDDAAQLREAFCTVVKYTALVAVPISTGLVAVAPELVTVLFGAKWVPSVPILQVLALVALVASLAWSAGDVFKALGHPQIQTRIVLIEGAVTLPAVALLTWLTGEAYMAAAGLLAGVIVSTAARLFLVRRHLAISRRDLARLYAGPLVGGGAILFTVYAAQQFAVDAPAGLVLAISVVLGTCVYGGAVWFVDRAAIERLGALTRRNRSIEQGRRVLAGTAGRLK